MKSVKEILFPRAVAPIRIVGFRLFNMGGRLRWFINLFKSLYTKTKRLKKW